MPQLMNSGPSPAIMYLLSMFGIIDKTSFWKSVLCGNNDVSIVFIATLLKAKIKIIIDTDNFAVLVFILRLKRK